MIIYIYITIWHWLLGWINGIKWCGWIQPKAQIQTFQFKVHISYFLQNCKKGNPPKIGFALLKIADMQSRPRCQTYRRFFGQMIFLSYGKYLQAILNDLCKLCTTSPWLHFLITKVWHVFNLLQCVIFLISLTCYPDYEKEQIEIKFYYQQVAS